VNIIEQSKTLEVKVDDEPVAAPKGGKEKDA